MENNASKSDTDEKQVTTATVIAWLKAEVEFKLPRGFIVGAGLVAAILLLVALD
ncbi:hypothetical protein LSUCC1028_08725 [Rhodobacterales bacterium LSUCC1028]|jgi:hypothetical protein|uniref:hypothetical protein n=1 Tax=Roseobacter sp. HKCCA2468 TaxID=3120342 RepID=UPI001D4A8CB3|nr:hypothetical protein [Rhodobacterales bacterium FZCC0069]MBF9027672.1 hypothetical protein [Rhodobacterales bacterium FZCC0188]MBF9054319.1 hypothetical protein [Rhodobacterales bacterium LSUCC1028]